jgi:flagellar protein FliS
MSNLAYDVYRQNNLTVESPQKLIQMMYEGILRFSALAKKSMAEGNTEKKVYWINRTTDIFAELINILDYEKGGESAYYLNGLYSHQINELALANSEDDPEKIDTVIKVTKGLLEAWREIHNM